MTHVLVVDDQESMRSITSQMLIDAGYKVTQAEDGEEGIKKFEADPASFDLVMADVNMPKKDGFELLKSIKEKDPKLPVILLTGTNEDIAQYVGKEHKAEAVLTKPFILDEVMQVVKKVISDNQ